MGTIWNITTAAAHGVANGQRKMSSATIGECFAEARSDKTDGLADQYWSVANHIQEARGVVHNQKALDDLSNRLDRVITQCNAEQSQYVSLANAMEQKIMPARRERNKKNLIRGGIICGAILVFETLVQSIHRQIIGRSGLLMSAFPLLCWVAIIITVVVVFFMSSSQAGSELDQVRQLAENSWQPFYKAQLILGGPRDIHHGASGLYDEVDSLYLAWLNPVDRASLLNRREQELNRQLQMERMMAAENLARDKMDQQQRLHDARMQQEQQRMRQQQARHEENQRQRQAEYDLARAREARRREAERRRSGSWW